MNAGQFDRRITLSRQGADNDDGYSTKPGEFLPYATVWAQLTPLTATERLAAAQNLASASIRFTIRKSPTVADVNPKDQLTYLESDYDITAVREDGRAYLVIDAVARADS